MRARITSVDNAKRKEIAKAMTSYDSQYHRKKWQHIYDADREISGTDEPAHQNAERIAVEDKLAIAFGEPLECKPHKLGRFMELAMNGPQDIGILVENYPHSKKREKTHTHQGQLCAKQDCFDREDD